MPRIVGSDAAHIIQVLRYGVGDLIALFDGLGGEYEAEILAVAPGQVQVSIIRQTLSHRDSKVPITVAQGYLKERKMDRVVRQLSEIGAMSWMPFPAQRSVVNLTPKRIAARKQRWEKIALEAAKQCGRNQIMAIEPASSYVELLDRAVDCAQRIVFWEKAPIALKDLLQGAIPAAQTGIMIILGPEGGFDPQEVQIAKGQGFVTAGLGPRILRAETAAVVACALVQYIFGDLG